MSYMTCTSILLTTENQLHSTNKVITCKTAMTKRQTALFRVGRVNNIPKRQIFHQRKRLGMVLKMISSETLNDYDTTQSTDSVGGLIVFISSYT